MDSMGDDDEACARFDALPEAPSDDDDLEITRYALLGPLFASPKPLPKSPPKQPEKVGGSSSSSKPTGVQRRLEFKATQRASAMYERMANDTSPYAIGNKDFLAGMWEHGQFEAMAAAEESNDDDSEDVNLGFGEHRCVYNLPEKPIAEWFDPLPKDFFKVTPSSKSAAEQPPWDSQLSSAGWRNWPIVDSGAYGLVYVVAENKFGYYDDEDDDECIVYFGQPLLSLSKVFARGQLRKPPFEGELVAV
eukprot:3902997-Prymnesium_polylepis.1